MRLRHVLLAAASPICLMAGAAQAETVISTETTSPVTTATAANGAVATAEQAGRVTAMARAGAHLLHLIEHVLDYSAIETGRIELREEHFALQDLAAACIELVMPAALERRLALRLVADAAAPFCIRDGVPPHGKNRR